MDNRVYDRDGITLYHQDCLSLILERGKSLGPFDCVITSPPYNIGCNYSLYQDSLPEDEYISWLVQCFESWETVLAPDGNIFFNLGYNAKDPMFPLRVMSSLVSKIPFLTQNIIHWVKNVTVDGHGSWGHFKPINSDRFLTQTHEYLFHFTRRGNTKINRLGVGVPYQDPSNSARWASGGNGIRCRGNVWHIPYKTIQSGKGQRPHPATFPIDLPLWCMKLCYRPEGDTLRVFDPFMGIGTTALACQQFGALCVGCDIDSGYLAVASQRLEERSNLGLDV